MQRDDNGLFIVFEGIDGSGKSSMALRLQTHLAVELSGVKFGSGVHGCYMDYKDAADKKISAAGERVVLTREPTDGEYGEQIRILANTREKQDPMEMLNLFESDRAYHVEQTIKPALGQGKIVISDRYFYSTAAYQGAFWNAKNPTGISMALNPSRILSSNAARWPVPDLVVVLDCPVVVALARIELSRPKVKMFEQEAYLELVRFRFGQMQFPNVAHINGLDSIERTFDKVWAAVEPVVGLWEKNRMEETTDCADAADQKGTEHGTNDNR